MKILKVVAVAAITAGAFLGAGSAQASPTICGSHADPSDMPFGQATSASPGVAVGADPDYIAACNGDSAAAVGSTAAGGTVKVPSLNEVPSGPAGAR